MKKVRKLKTHRKIDLRSLHLANAIVDKIESDSTIHGQQKAIDNCERWLTTNPCSAIKEWREILNQPWSEVKIVLLDRSEDGNRLRQNNPFCGILTPRERWQIYKKWDSIR